ncbi:hypothetical protein QQS21_000797 [Conoideocrella luteorostrata]|uniref:HD domain-containing protein n=1 Tax=Conoideocrella luteorostrata TaxID=1105319 RepID=A0AAJ0CYE7_9HYPO|nr:hypothetical protein QQS21_000797 [Conoideocrella luteorostrata]
MASLLKDIPEIGLQITSTSIIDEALAFAKQHCNEMTINHVIRSAYWASIVAKKDPAFSNSNVDMEAVILSCILHDMGWAATKSLLSDDKRFEVDGANIAKHFIKNATAHNAEKEWQMSRIQRCWDAIALHTTPSIALHAAPEVALVAFGIMADFMGPSFPDGTGKLNIITVEEYHAVMTLFPRAGFTIEGFKQVVCGFCRDKPATTYDNFVGVMGTRYGTDGKGAGKEEFKKAWEDNQVVGWLVTGLTALEQLDAER